MPPTKELTDEIKAELSGKSVDEKRIALTKIHKQGYSIKSYLQEEISATNNGRPDEKGFKPTEWAEDKLWTYHLLDGEDRRSSTDFIFQELPDGNYKPWP